jgi:hypothetical protein
MERIMYRKTLDVHKNGIQFLLQGFETADNLSRVIEISLMASGDAIDFPLEKIEALMYVTTPGATEPSINKCTIKDNKIIYEVLPIVEEGITNMQLKLIETGIEGAKSVLASPKFAVEVTKSDADDSGAEQTTTFTALEDAMAKAKSVYEERFLRMELSSDCLFRAYYADGTIYETDVLQRLFLNGNVLLSESFAHGGTGVRVGEDTDNSKYYSDVSKSEVLKAKDIMENSEEILEEVKLHGVYTAFSVDFETGEVEYVSPSFSFKINKESGELDAIGQTYTFNEEVGRIVEEWLSAHGVVIADLQDISTKHSTDIGTLYDVSAGHSADIEILASGMDANSMDISNLKVTTQAHTDEIVRLSTEVRPIELGGTGASTKEGAIASLGIDKYQRPWNVTGTLGVINAVSKTLEVSWSSLKTDYQTSSVEIPMINSGDLYLSASGLVLDSDNLLFGDEASCPRFTIEKNGVVIHEVTALVKETDWKNFTDSLKKPYLLSVNKGDIIKVTLGAQGNGKSESGSISLYRINLIANVDTAYKYITLSNEESAKDSENEDISDILNIILGVDE